MQIQPINHSHQTSPTQPESAATVNTSSPDSTPGQSPQTTVAKKDSGDNAGHTEDQQEKQTIERLQARDREVRAHEAAHKAAAGSFARGGATFEYQTGPDGKRYAVGGEVSIDTSKIANNPEATIRKAQTIRRAATAPAQPSGQDRSVAAQASKMETEARQEINQQKASGQDSDTGEYASIKNQNHQADTADTAGDLLDIFA